MSRVTIFVAIVLIMAGCASEGLRFDRSAPKTFDGLTKIANTEVDSAWVREGFDPSRYSKIMFVGKGIEYADVRPMAQSQLRSLASPRCRL